MGTAPVRRPRGRMARAALLAAPAAAIVLAFFACLAAMVYYSVRPSLGMAQVGSGFTLENYARFLGDPYYLGYLWRSIRAAVVSTAIVAVLGFAVAYYMSRSGPVVRLVTSLVLVVQFFTAYVVRTYALMLILGRNGVVNRTLVALGLIEAPLPLMYNELGVVIGLVLVSIPFMVFPVYSSLLAIEANLDAAAESLGAGPLERFWTVTVPLAMPGVAAGTVVVFLFTLTAYVIPGLLGGGYFEMIANLIYDKAMGAQDYPFAAASAMVTLVVTATLVYGLQRAFAARIRGA
ncbi:MAG TPA: ABC transporter permease [Thermodesulfobacteriota bacterium]